MTFRLQYKIMQALKMYGRNEEFESLKFQIHELYEKHGKPEQLMLQTSSDCDDWQSGTGKAPIADPLWETRFCRIQPSLLNTPIDRMSKSFGVSLFRLRIMAIPPKRVYSMHRDLMPRIHLPIKTNSQCYFIFKDPCEIHHLPAEGNAFWVDTTRFHTFMNGGNDVRIHLVAATMMHL